MFKFTDREEKGLHEAFEVGVIIKGVDGIAELIGGAFLFFVSPGTIQNIFLYFARPELAEDPHDFITNYLLHMMQGLSVHVQHFYALLFIIHGVIKLFLIIGLAKNRLWAYPAAIAAFSSFVLYQFYRLSITHSPLLALINIVDIVVIALIVHEYMEVKKRLFTRKKTAG